MKYWTFLLFCLAVIASAHDVFRGRPDRGDGLRWARPSSGRPGFNRPGAPFFPGPPRHGRPPIPQQDTVTLTAPDSVPSPTSIEVPPIERTRGFTRPHRGPVPSSPTMKFEDQISSSSRHISKSSVTTNLEPHHSYSKTITSTSSSLTYTSTSTTTTPAVTKSVWHIKIPQIEPETDSHTHRLRRRRRRRRLLL